MTLHLPLNQLRPMDAATLKDAIKDGLYWLRHVPRTTEDHMACARAFAGLDRAVCLLTAILKGEAS